MLKLKQFCEINSKSVKQHLIRKFNQGSIKHDSNNHGKDTPTEMQKSSPSNLKSRNLGPMMIKPTEFQKKILVWVKKYPSKDKVPDRISLDAMSAAQTKARIKTCNYMIVLTVIGFISAVVLGKQEAAKGYDMTDKLLHEANKKS